MVACTFLLHRCKYTSTIKLTHVMFFIIKRNILIRENTNITIYTSKNITSKIYIDYVPYCYRFPVHLFGKCLGLIQLCSGVISCLQYALFSWANNTGNFALVRITFVYIPKPLLINHVMESRLNLYSRLMVVSKG